jgi:hypothetical protein
LNFEHAGTDYARAVTEAYEVLREPLAIHSPDSLVPFNPVTSDPLLSPRAAFFGLNAYSGHLAEACRHRNFFEWCQNNYNAKLFIVMNLWRERVCETPASRGSIYYSNFVKVVLPQALGKEAKVVERVLKRSPATVSLLTDLATEELARLKNSGCEIFVCFGVVAHRLMQEAARRADVTLIREIHYSHYRRQNTDDLIAEAERRKLIS